MAEEKVPHNHAGHRQRLRQRFCATGLSGFAPHEVLELMLGYAIPRQDVNPLAHTLMDTFGSLQGVLEAKPDQLLAVHGVGEETATLIGRGPVSTLHSYVREVIAYALDTYALDPSETVMVGDRKHDVIGARENGLACIGVLYGYGSREELTAAGAAALAADLGELSALLKS